MVRKPLIQLALLTVLATCSFGQSFDSLRTKLLNAYGDERVDILHQLVLSQWLKYPDQAMAYGHEALSLSAMRKDSSNISKSLRLIAGVHYYMGNFDTSLDYNLRALNIAINIKDSSLINKGYNNVGLLYYDLGSYQSSLEYLLRSKAIKENIGEERGIESTLNNIGLVFERVSSFEEARKNFQEGFNIAVRNGNKDIIVYSMNNIGITYRKEGDFQLARQYFDSALLLANEIGNVNWGAVSNRNIGEILRYEGHYDSADTYYNRSLQACKEIDDSKGMAETYTFMAKLALDLGDVKLATSYLDMSHDIASKIKLRYQLLENLRLYASIHLVEKDNKKVITNQFKYLDLRDSLFSDAISRNLAFVPIKLKEEEDRLQLSKQQAELNSKSTINRLYAAIIIGAIPLISLLVVLLRRNRIAYRKLIEKNDELKRTQNLLVTSEKMASLGVLAAGVGHEINNPLNYIKNGVSSLNSKMEKKYSTAKNELKQYFEIIDEGVSRASKIVKSLSHFSRVGVDADEYCKVEEIIENCLLILGNKLRKIDVIKEFSKQPTVVHGSEGKLHQAFMNIIANAEQAIEGKGRIKIVTQANNGRMTVSIKDNGIGIPEENMIKIGDPFFTTKPPGEGTGLGLFITYAIIEEHRGNIQVRSEVKNGTEFIITLPLYRQN